ncbi:MAG: HAMP domain-containing sensor histidine kinase [bacterium]|nr:HAMP domain-containing sensor histidine kinase [bacterium]
MAQIKRLRSIFHLLAGVFGGIFGGFVLLFTTNYLKGYDWLSTIIWLGVCVALGVVIVYLIAFKKHLKVVTYENQKLQEISDAKTEFVFFIVHQLRSPLSALRLSFLMFQGGDFGKLSAKQEEVIQTGIKEIDGLLEMIAGLLDISKIEQRQLPINKTTVSLSKFLILVENLLKDFSLLIKQKNISFDYKIPPVAEKIFLEIDWGKLTQVFDNLLDNALHYTRENGQISLNITVEKNNVVVALSDSGIGIPKLEQSDLFEKFYRATNAKALSSKGTGIGLYLAKFIVEGHGGKIWFISEENHGTTFYFKLPLKATVEEFLEHI